MVEWDQLRSVSDHLREWAALGWRLWRARVAGPDEAALAAELGRLRRSIGEAIGAAESCAGCARGHPLPHGRFEGGFCCGGTTGGVFSDSEVAALALAGTRPWHLPPPVGAALAGCLFRRPTRCALSPLHRPSVCVAHLCTDLQRELCRRGALARVERLCGELSDGHDRYRRLREQRQEREWFEELTR